jgi:hypothetical protein
LLTAEEERYGWLLSVGSRYAHLDHSTLQSALAVLNHK